MSKALTFVGYSVSGIGGLVMILLSLGLHLYTMYLSYIMGGMLALVLTAIFPGISELYWIITLTVFYGMWINPLTIGAAIWLVVLAVMVAGSSLLNR